MEKEGEPRSEKIDDEGKREDAFLAHDVTRNLSFSSSLHHPVAFFLSFSFAIHFGAEQTQFTNLEPFILERGDMKEKMLSLSPPLLHQHLLLLSLHPHHFLSFGGGRDTFKRG